MKSASLIKDPNQKFEDLKDLGSRLKLPPGWKFRSPILEQDLVFMTDNGNTNDHSGRDWQHLRPGRRPLQQLQAVAGIENNIDTFRGIQRTPKSKVYSV